MERGPCGCGPRMRRRSWLLLPRSASSTLSSRAVAAASSAACDGARAPRAERAPVRSGLLVMTMLMKTTTKWPRLRARCLLSPIGSSHETCWKRRRRLAARAGEGAGAAEGAGARANARATSCLVLVLVLLRARGGCRPARLWEQRRWSRWRRWRWREARCLAAQSRRAANARGGGRGWGETERGSERSSGSPSSTSVWRRACRVMRRRTLCRSCSHAAKAFGALRRVRRGVRRGVGVLPRRCECWRRRRRAPSGSRRRGQEARLAVHRRKVVRHSDSHAACVLRIADDVEIERSDWMRCHRFVSTFHW